MADLHEDPSPGAHPQSAFLALLGRDIEKDPARLRTLDTALMARIDRLTGDVELDIEAPLPVEHD